MNETELTIDTLLGMPTTALYTGGVVVLPALSSILLSRHVSFSL